MEETNLHIGSSPDLLEKPSIVNSGVRKLNKKPIIIALIGLMLLLLGLGYAAAMRGQSNAVKNNSAHGQQSVNDSQTQLASMVDDLQKGIKKAPLTSAKNESEPTATNTNDPLSKFPYADTEQNTQHKSYTERTDAQARMKAQEKTLEDERKRVLNAIASPTKIRVEQSTYNANATSNKQASPGATTASTQSDAPANGILRAYLQSQEKETDNDTRNEPFLKKADKKSYDYLATQKVSPLSPYEVKAGTVIPGVMITGINSDLPGQLLGTVSENVYDTATGQYLLIPQGSKLVGLYSANVIFGQERVLIAWNRIIFPDAKTLSLGAMPGTDQAGYAGFTDLVNNHYMKIFGSAFMMSMITGGIALSSNNNGNQYTETNSDKMISSMIQEMGEVGKQMIQKNLNIAPTLEIRPGYRFNIFVTKDIILEPLNY
ncbi:MAG: TrbI/VirB10 family protein [Bacilli bacterium]|nr:TrbI/VirB10 family protein [Bacilli bacterium]